MEDVYDIGKEKMLIDLVRSGHRSGSLLLKVYFFKVDL